ADAKAWKLLEVLPGETVGIAEDRVQGDDDLGVPFDLVARVDDRRGGGLSRSGIGEADGCGRAAECRRSRGRGRIGEQVGVRIDASRQYVAALRIDGL